MPWGWAEVYNYFQASFTFKSKAQITVYETAPAPNICKSDDAAVLTILNGSLTFDHAKRAYLIYAVAENDICDAATKESTRGRHSIYFGQQPM